MSTSNNMAIDLFREQILAAVVAGWHAGISAKLMRNKLYSEFLDEADWMKARKMAILLSVANGLDVTQRQVIHNPAAFVSNGRAILSVNAEGDCSLEMQAVEKHSKAVQKEFGAELQIVFK